MITKEILKSGDAFVIKTVNTQDVTVQKEVGGELVTETKESVSFTYSNPVTVAELTGSTGRLKIQECTMLQPCQKLKKPMYGMTPHIISVESQTEHETVFIASCAMHDCGVHIFKDETFDDFKFDVLQAKVITMPNKDFVNFKNYKDADFYI